MVGSDSDCNEARWLPKRNSAQKVTNPLNVHHMSRQLSGNVTICRVEFMADAKIGAAGSVAGFAAEYRGSLRLRVALDHGD